MNKKIRNDIDRELSRFTFVTDERLEALKSGGGKEIRMKVNKKIIGIGIAAAVAAGSAVTVGAVNDWDYSGLISRLFTSSENNEQSAQLLDGLIHRVSDEYITNTFTNYDVTVDGYMSDNETVRLCVTFANKDGSPFTEYTDTYCYGTDDRIEFEPDSVLHWTGGGTGFEVTEDGLLQFDAKYNFKGELTKPEKARFILKKLTLDGMTDEDYEKYKNYPTVSDDEVDWFDEEYIYYQHKSEPCRKIPIEEYKRPLDRGELVVELLLVPNTNTKEFILMNKDGEALTATLSAAGISIEHDTGIDDIVTFVRAVSGTLFIYDENGSELITSDNITGDGGYDGRISISFDKPIDIEKAAAIRCAEYKYGEVPPLDLERFPYVRDYYGITE